MNPDQKVVLIIEGEGVVVVVGALLVLILVAAIMTATTSSAVSLFPLLPVPEQLVRRVLLLCVVYDNGLFSILSQLHNRI
jgi:hypothetical protein